MWTQGIVLLVDLNRRQVSIGQRLGLCTRSLWNVARIPIDHGCTDNRSIHSERFRHDFVHGGPDSRGLDATLDGGVVARFQRSGQFGLDAIEVHIHRAGHQSPFIHQQDTLEPPFPEVTRHLVFSIEPPRGPLAQELHVPGDIAEPGSPLGHFLGVRQHFGHLLVVWIVDQLAFAIGDDRAELVPLLDDLCIGPLGEHIGTRSQDQMEVVFHDGITEQIDGKATRNLLQLAFELASTTPIGLLGRLVIAQEEELAHALVHAVHDGLFIGAKDLRTQFSSHGFTSGV